MDVKPWEWMVKPTPQKDWIAGEGMLIWLAFFAIELGAGMYFVSIFLENTPAMIVGWLLTPVIGAGFLFLHLGQKKNIWRAVLSKGFKTSWISRGTIFIGAYALVGLIHQVLYHYVSIDAAYSVGIVEAVLCILVMIYGGFVISSISSIPMWHTPLIPILFVVGSFWGGAEIAFAFDMTKIAPESWIKILLPIYIFILILYIFTVSTGLAAGKYAIKQILRGDLAAIFWIGTILIGVLIPFSIYILTFVGNNELSTPVVFIAVASGLIGDLSMRYCIMRTGYYAPLVPSSHY
ncbi:MAG: polysulfide reductase NrfD [Chloroflexi bacterium]|nr:polysulfide reductase NrfD [Chloroflexota bacterium]